jgi:hypothetical protein
MSTGNAVEVVAKILQKSLERREWPADPKTVVDIAEVIVEGLREPTEDMLEMAEGLHDPDAGFFVDRVAAAKVWEAMLSDLAGAH